MATELEGNEKLQRFIHLLSDLNQQTAQLLKTGNMQLLYPMNDTVEEMYSIQHAGTEEAYTAIEEDAQIIYKNFNAVVTMVRSVDGDTMDEGTAKAVRKFMTNIFEANVRIVLAYGLA